MGLLYQLSSSHKNCVVNADLDGILSGLILHQVLDWNVVGFSMCNGTSADEIWVDPQYKMKECVFVDLPVIMEGVECIDQHFNAITQEGCAKYRQRPYLANPNNARGRYYLSPTSGYTYKYPFGTVHYIIAGLEKLGYNIELDLRRDLGNFTGLDVLLRADRVIGNSLGYARNCQDWAKWLDIGSGKCGITNLIYQSVMGVNNLAAQREKLIEDYLKSLGCARADGDFSNMLRGGDYAAIQKIVTAVGDCIGADALSISRNMNSLGIFVGYRRAIDFAMVADTIGRELESNNIFSLAIVNSKEASFTKII